MGDRLNCFICNNFVNAGLNGLMNHFKYRHGLTINRGYGQGGFICGQNGCQRSFSLFTSMRKHIRREHSNDRVEENEYGILERQEIGGNNNVVENLQIENDRGVENVEDQNVNHNMEDDYANFNIRLSIVRMVSRLQAKGCVTGALLTDVLDEFQEAFFDIINYMKYHVKKFVNNRNIAEEEDTIELLERFEFDNPFENLSSLTEQIDALKDHCGYIDSIELSLDYRLENVFDSETGTYIQRKVYETYQYVPVIDVLTTVMSNREIREAVLSERPSEPGILESFVDGETFKGNRFFQLHRCALRLKLYYDDLEIVSPLGSKTGSHKLGAFYYIIDNVPEHINSQLGGIHVLCLCYTEDIKKYGFHRILERFLQDLERLESVEGVQIFVNGQEFTLRASISVFCGDGLAVHEVFGLLGPSANCFCRLCMIKRQDLLAGDFQPAEQRSRESFARHLDRVRNAGPTQVAIDRARAQTGVLSESPLNSSRYFHIADNKVFDIMHDVLIGVGPMTLKLVLFKLVLENRFFTIEYFNGQIVSFQYGLMEVKNKPSPNFTVAKIRNLDDNTLSQKAMQMWCLLRVFPFLVAEKIPEDNEHMNLILTLLRIMEIIFAPKLTISILPYLRALIIEFIDLFKELFPDKNLINKFHHMTHYADCILSSGPLVKLWCMGFERKHGPIKRRAQVVNNFKNSPKTLIRVCQSVQSAMWGACDLKLHSIKSRGGRNTLVELTLSEKDLIDNGYLGTDTVFKTKYVSENGAKYAVGLFVCLDANSQDEINLPLFGKINEIIIGKESVVFLRTIICSTIHLETAVNAYLIEWDEKNGPTTFVQSKRLAHYRSFSTWALSIPKKQYISLRHIIL